MALQIVAIAKLVFHAQGVDHRHDAVEPGYATLDILRSHRGDGADGLCDWGGLADAACLDDDVVEAPHLYDFAYLLDQVHLERAADAAILQSHEAVVLLVDHSALLYEVGVDVYLTDIVDDDGKLDALLIGENFVDQCGLAATKIAREQQNGYLLYTHNIYMYSWCLYGQRVQN